MTYSEARQHGKITYERLAALVALVALAVAAGYRAWVDIATIGLQDPEQSQVLLAIPAFIALLCFRKESLAKAPVQSSMLGVIAAGVGWAVCFYGYMNAVQSFWHFGALLMVLGAAWAVFGDRKMLAALPAILALVALVPVPNLLRQDIALPLQRMTAAGAEFVLIALHFDVDRMGLTLLYNDKPVTIEEACNGMRMVFALVLVCFTFVMSIRLTLFTRFMLLGFCPLLAVICNIIRVVPTVVIYGEFGDRTGDIFHDVSGWAMIVLAALMLLGLIRLLNWAQVPIYSNHPPKRPLPPSRKARRGGIQPFAGPVAVALLMVAATLHSLTIPSAADAKPYHRAVALAARQTPIGIDGLEAEPIDLPEGSLKMLRPNTARAVQYNDTFSGTTGQFLLIQSRDARDLAGHYPPRCYPNVYGYIEVDSKQREWTICGRVLHGVEYTFAQSSAPGAPRWVVMHLFALPGGETTGDLTQMRAAAADYLRRHEGAAQVQLLFNEAQASPRQRDQMFEQVLTAHAHLINTILDGPTQEHAQNNRP